MNRILFVDDEPQVLEALRNSLRGKRKIWDMVFKGSAAEGLTELNAGQFDVIVSDMRMPHMNGVVFLGHAAKACPRATRIVLSGHAEESMLAKAARVAHCYLTKPCANELLCATLTRALDLHDLLKNERIRACVGSIESLPAVPKVYRALNDALSSERASPELVARIVAEDVAMSAKLLQIVNSSFFGLARKTTSLLQTVRYLGLGTIRSLVLSQSLFDQLGQANAELAEQGQQHALSCARSAQELLNGKPDAELAFTAGLLHDVGSLVLASRMPEEYGEIRALAAATAQPVHVVERERLGIDHAAVGAYLLGLWGLPHEVLDVVAFHHAPWAEPSALDAASAVRLADFMVSDASEDRGGALSHAEPPPHGWLEARGGAAPLQETP